jgi:hypothetical protein
MAMSPPVSLLITTAVLLSLFLLVRTVIKRHRTHALLTTSPHAHSSPHYLNPHPPPRASAPREAISPRLLARLSVPDVSLDTGDADTCPVCLLPCAKRCSRGPCGCVVHSKCLRTWVARACAKCPLCAADFIKSASGRLVSGMPRSMTSRRFAMGDEKGAADLKEARDWKADYVEDGLRGGTVDKSACNVSV